MQDVRAAIDNLRAKINRLDDLYYKGTKSEVSDREYDGLKRELAKLEDDYALFAAGEASPSKIVGDDRLEGFVTYRHRQPRIDLLPESVPNACG
jgi:DNA ligase (NAD+)